jgi:hypothetical protein
MRYFVPVVVGPEEGILKGGIERTDYFVAFQAQIIKVAYLFVKQYILLREAKNLRSIPNQPPQKWLYFIVKPEVVVDVSQMAFFIPEVKIFVAKVVLAKSLNQNLRMDVGYGPRQVPKMDI